MQKIRVLDPYSNHIDMYRMDADRIAKCLADRGYEATPQQAVRLWERYSESFAAGWLGLPESDEEVFECVRPYFEPVE